MSRPVYDWCRVEVQSSASAWTDVSDDVMSVETTRKDGDVGTASLVLLGAQYDPTVTTLLRAARKVRVSVKSGASWLPIFVGRVENVDVDFLPTRVTVALQDLVADLANRPESRSVGTIEGLRWLMHGAGFSFTINGTATSSSTGEATATNDNASLWDQIMLARDSAGGYAWVSRSGVLTAYDASSMPTTIRATLGPSVYRDLTVDYNTADIINSLRVEYLRLNLANGESVSVPYGPFEDAASVAAWGRREDTVSVTGIPETEAAITAHANAVLARTASTEERPVSAIVPMLTSANLALAHQVDLNDRVSVVYADESTTKTVRVVGVQHQITPTSWSLTFEFASTGQASPPRKPPRTASPYLPPGSVGEDELAVDFASPSDIERIENEHAASVSLLEGEIQDARDEAESGRSANALAISNAVSDYTAKLAQKSRTTYSTSSPGTAANTAGDIWFRTNSATPPKVLQQWRGLGGTSWQEVGLDTTFIPKVHIGDGTFGSLAGDRLQANTVGTQHLIVADLENLAQVGDFEDPLVRAGFPATAPWSYATVTRGGGVVGAVVTSPSVPDAKLRVGEKFTVKAGDELVLSGEGICTTATFGPQYACLELRVEDKDGNWLTDLRSPGSSIDTPVGAWKTLNGIVTVPANAVRATPFLRWVGVAGAGAYAFSRVHVMRRFGGELIVDGSIATRHITSDFVESLLVTGRVLQTHSDANKGMKMSSLGLLGYNAAGNATMSFNASTGTMTLGDPAGVGAIIVDGSTGSIWMKGSLTSGSTISGSTISGSIITAGSTVLIGDHTTSSGAVHIGSFSGIPQLQFFTGNAGGDTWQPGSIWSTTTTDTDGENLTLQIISPRWAAGTGGAAERAIINVQSNRSGSTYKSRIYMRADILQLNTPETTTTPGNVFMADGGRIARHTSSRRYKTDIEPLGIAPADVLALDPVRFLMNGQVGVGFVAEDAEELGLGEWVTRDAEDRADGFAYATWTAAQQVVLRDLAARIEALEAS